MLWKLIMQLSGDRQQKMAKNHCLSFRREEKKSLTVCNNIPKHKVHEVNQVGDVSLIHHPKTYRMHSMVRVMKTVDTPRLSLEEIHYMTEEKSSKVLRIQCKTRK